MFYSLAIARKVIQIKKFLGGYLMAGMQFNVQDRASVDAWKKRAQELNEKANKLVREAAEVLEEFKQTAEGQIFDKVVEYSSNVIAGVNKVLDGMNQILSTVNDLISSILAKIGEIVTDVGNTQSNVIG